MGQLRSLWLALLLVGGGLAGAEKVDRATVEATRKHYEAAVKAYDVGEFGKAVEEYKAAYDLKQDPVFLYNIAQAFRLAKNLEQAVFFYRSYLRKLPAATNRAEVEARIQELENVMTPNPPNHGTGTTSPTKEPEPAPDPARVDPSSTTPAPSAATSAPTSDGPRPKPKLWIVGVVLGAVALVAGAVILGVVLGTMGSGPSAPVSHFGPVTVAF